jgi:hypothetical protein
MAMVDRALTLAIGAAESHSTLPVASESSTDSTRVKMNQTSNGGEWGLAFGLIE